MMHLRRHARVQRSTPQDRVRATQTDLEPNIRRVIGDALDACARDTGTTHPTSMYTYSHPLGHTVRVQRSGITTQYATIAEYDGPLGKWYTFIGQGIGQLFCIALP